VTTPAPSASAPSLPSTAQAVLDAANAIHATPEPAGFTKKTAQPDVEPSMLEALGDEGDVEVEVSDGEGKRTRNLSWSDAMKQVPPDIRALMKNMQKDYTKKTQELSEARKEFIREREALLKGQQALKVPETLPEYDPFNEASINARIEAEVNKRLNAVLEPMKQEYEVMAAEESYQSFLAEHPEFKNDKELRGEVQRMLEANTSLDLETAYWAAKGRMNKAQATKEAEAAKARRAADREAATRATALPRKGTATMPAKADTKKMSNADILAMAQALHRR
jgi:hypothetical protein